MSVRVERLTQTQLEARMASILRDSGMTIEELRRAGEAFELDAVQRGRLAIYEGYEWLASSR